MKTGSLFLLTPVLCLLLLVLGTSSAFGGTLILQDKAQLSDAETKAVKAVEGAADVNAKLVAATDFVKKYPKSSARPHVSEYVASQIIEVKDGDQKLALAKKFQSIFTESTEAEVIQPSLIDAYLHLSRFDDAFASGATYLARNDDIQVLVALAIAGTEQAKAKNTKFAAASQQYGAKALNMFENNKKPADMDDAYWNQQKALLPQLYQEMGIIAFMQQKQSDAQGLLEKATVANPADPMNYLLLASITNDEYQKVAQTYQSMPEGKSKDDLLSKANQLMDKVIDQYAHTLALSEGKPTYQRLHDQTLEDMTAYYKYRHKNSTDGLQKLIDGYKLK
jgi:hypothetical protein